MTAYKRAQAEKVFSKLSVAESQSRDFRRGFLVDDKSGERLFPPVYFSRESEDLYPAISRKLRIGLRLLSDEFEELMCCRMSKESYFEIRRLRDGR